jgi:hypothetical protein
MSILEDDSIFSSSRGSYLFLFKQGGKAMVGSYAIYLFVSHRTFYFHLNVAFSFWFDLAFEFLFMCECGHRLDAYGKHLVCCSFGGQQIVTHDAI